MISEKAGLSNWGDNMLEQVSKDLKYKFPDMKGLSRTNLSYSRQFFEFYRSSIVQQAVGRLQTSNKLNSEIFQHPAIKNSKLFQQIYSHRAL